MSDKWAENDSIPIQTKKNGAAGYDGGTERKEKV